MRSICCLTFAFAICTFAQGQPILSKKELDIAKAVEANMPYALKLLEETVNINTGAFNIPGVKKVGERYAKELQAFGFTTAL